MFDFSVDKQMFLCYSINHTAEQAFRTNGCPALEEELGNKHRIGKDLKVFCLKKLHFQEKRGSYHVHTGYG